MPKKASNDPTNTIHYVTPDDVRAIEGYENATEEEVLNVLETLKLFAQVTYEMFQQNKQNNEQ